jgi:DNA (cytosine-5)-methyltransferase 1
MKYFSMFSGIGGFELGILRAFEKTRPDALPTLRCVGFSEIDKHATQIYQGHFHDHTNYGDATTIIAKDLPDFDLLVGGFPCQAFSIAGKRKGFADTRGTLFFDIVCILKAKRPRNFILENVRGLLSHDDGKTFRTIIATLADLGYCVEWQVLNSKDFGVPQHRERVYLVGHLGAVPRIPVFPVPAAHEPAQTNGLRNRCRGIAIPVITPDRPNKKQNGRRFKENGDPSFALTGQDRHGVFDGISIRRLTPLECERLQGFPDGWTAGVSDTQRYKCCGNAVTVPVVQAVMERLLRSGLYREAFSRRHRCRSVTHLQSTPS